MDGYGAAGDLFAAVGGRRAIPVSAEISMTPGGGFGLVVGLRRADLAELLGARPRGDIALVSRNVEVAATLLEDGVHVTAGGDRPKLGPSARPANGEEGEWLIGPLPLALSAGGHARERLERNAAQGLLPLRWEGVSALLVHGHLDLPDLLSRPAAVGAPPPRPSPTPRARSALERVRRMRLPPQPAAAAATADLPDPDRSPLRFPPPADVSEPARVALHAAMPPRAASAPAGDAAVRRHRAARARLSACAGGRIGLTLPDAAVEALLAGRHTEGPWRECLVAELAGDLLVMPAGDPAGPSLGAVPLRLRASEGGRWYGRVAHAGIASRLPGGAATLRDGSGFTCEAQPGRVLLRGALSASPVSPPPGAGRHGMRHPAADRLSRARRLLSEALGLVREAQADGAAEIEILDAGGSLLVAVPPGAAAARIRIEV